MRFLERWTGSAPARGDYPRVTADDEGVTCEPAEGRRDAIAWRDLDEVRVVITSVGPFAESALVVLVARAGGFVVPLTRIEPILARLMRLPGFDHGRMREAMGGARDASYTVWRGGPSEEAR